MDMVIQSQSSSTAAAVSPTDNTITHEQVLTQVANDSAAPTHNMHTESTPKRTLQTHITPNKRSTGSNWSNGTKASLEESAVREVVPQQKIHGSDNDDPFHSHSLEMFDKLQLLEKQPNDDGVDVNKNGNEERSQMGVDNSKRVTFQGDVTDRIAAVPTTAMPTTAVPTSVSKIFTKKYHKENNRLTCPHCAKGFVSQGGLDYHVLLACQNKLPTSLIITTNKPTKDVERKKRRSKSMGGIAKITSDYWQHGVLSTAATNQKSQSSSPSAIFPSQKRKLPKGVYETIAGNYQVVQVKFKPNEPLNDTDSIGYQENDTFLSLSNPTYKSVLYTHFQQMDNNDTQEEEKRMATKITDIFKKNGGRFYKKSGRGNREMAFVQVDEDDALRSE